MPANVPPPIARADGNARDPAALLQPSEVDDASSKSPVLSELQGVESFQSQLTPPATRSTSRLPRLSTPQAVKDKDKNASKTPTATTPSNVALDPLSTQIFLRTNSNTEPTIAQRLRGPHPESSNTDNIHRQVSETATKPLNITPDVLRDRRKGPSFLSRLSMRGSWKKEDDIPDSDSELGELREDGSDARALTAAIGDGGGYIPFHKEPTRYIRVKPHNKKDRDFNHLFLAQELLGVKPTVDQDNHSRTPATAVGSKLLKGGAAIWAAEFSVDGRYLAVAGQDKVVRVFSVISTPEERKAHEEEEAARGGEGEKLSAPVFRNKPTREFEGHTNDVLALSWSKNNFLLSSSMDKTVKLWHLSRSECLCTFKHSDLVTSIAFHPTDDRFFLAGSLDAQLRLWSIPDKSVAFSAPTTDFITAVAFSPDGKTAICGLLNGMCIFHETEGMKQQFQIHVRSSRGKNAKGSKITGIKTAKLPTGSDEGDVRVLVTSNDSRVRVYNLRTKMLEVKFKGLENQSSQIHARFSDDAKYVICGSEDRKAYIWDLTHSDVDTKDKQPYESFDAHPEVVTTALMAPTTSRQLLSASEDPLYDLCNPPPVTLLSLDESTASLAAQSDGENVETPTAVPVLKKPEESPAYIQRCKHTDGNIIVTTDRSGTIKVFRQDCAFAKRQQNLWETGSRISGRLTGVGRSASIMTKTSAGSRVHSRRGSVNLGSNPVQVQPVSDRIMSWRQDIEGGRASFGGGSIRSERSLSPMKATAAMNSSTAGLASGARRSPYTSSPVLRPHDPRSPPGSIRRTSNRYSTGPSLPPTPSFSLVSAADSNQQDTKPEGGFWNFNRWRNLPSLRYSTAPTSPIAHTIEESSPDAPTKVDSLALPSRKLSGRRSLGVNEMDRIKRLDDASRRKSLGALMQKPRLSLSDSGAQGIEEKPETEDEPTPLNKKRTDSGVGRLSADSSLGGDSNTTCDGCGSIDFKLTKVDDGKMAMICNKCGVAGEP
ncbi:putative WD repeat-containing protein C3H5.08c [Paramyrothecium foliicola]|nr:putative WD repeat-containing protein C3H5.08c [Paramyrothecium foliicola]